MPEPPTAPNTRPFRRRPPVLLWAVLVLLASGCGEGPERGADGAVPTEVASFLLHYLEAMELRDTTTLRTMLAADDDFVWIEDGAVRYRSADDVFRGLATFPADATVRTVIGEVEATPIGTGGVHAWTPFATTLGEGPGAYIFHGMLSFVLERREGRWIVVGGHTSTLGPR